MTEYVTLDLREIAASLGDHYSPAEVDATCGQCPVCRDRNVLTWVSQEEAGCPVCGTPIVWHNSKLWQSLFGTPAERIRQLRAIPASTQSGKRLHQGAGVPGWPSKADADAWQKAVQARGDLEMGRIAEYVLSKHTGMPAVRHAVNIARTKVREASARKTAETYLPAEVPEAGAKANDPPAINIVTGKEP